MSFENRSTLAYLGVDASTPPQLVRSDRDPVPGDWNFPIGTFWLRIKSNHLWVLVSTDLNNINDPLLGDRAWWVQLWANENIDFLTDEGLWSRPAAEDIIICGQAGLIETASPNTILPVVGNRVQIKMVGNANVGLTLITQGAGLPPVWGHLTSLDHSVTIVEAAGTIDFSVAPAAVFGGLTGNDGNTAVPDAINRRIITSGESVIWTRVAGPNTLRIGFTASADKKVLTGDTATGFPLWKTLTSPLATITIVDTGADLEFDIAGAVAFAGLSDQVGTVASPDPGTQIVSLIGDTVITTHQTAAHEMTIRIDGGNDDEIVGGITAGTADWKSLMSGDASIIFDFTNPIQIDMRSVGGGVGVNSLTGDDGAPAAAPLLGTINVVGLPNTILRTVGHPLGIPNTLQVEMFGGTAGQVVSADGAGVLNWYTLTGTPSVVVTLDHALHTITLTAPGGGGGGIGSVRVDVGANVIPDGLATIGVYGNENINTANGGVNDVYINLDRWIIWPNNTVNVPLETGIEIAGARFMHNRGLALAGGGSTNTFLGSQAGNLNLTLATAINNTGIGAKTLTNITSGHDNTILGFNEAPALTTGINNTQIGSQGVVPATYSNTVGIGYSTYTGNGAIAIGSGAYAANGADVGSIAIGYLASAHHEDCVAIGYKSQAAALREDEGNTSVGYLTLNVAHDPAPHMGSSRNTAVGSEVLRRVTTGGANSSYGYKSATTLTTGDMNSSYGSSSLGLATTSGSNCSFGVESLASLTTSVGYNSAFGKSSLSGITTGRNDIALGASSGSAHTGADSSCIDIGHVGVNGQSNEMHLGTDDPAFGPPGLGEIDKCYIAGIYNRTIATPAKYVFIDNTGKLGTGLAGGFPAFLGIQKMTVNNAVGDGLTPYYLGARARMWEEYDSGNNFYEGSGAGAKCTFTAPFNGLYYLSVSVRLVNIPTAPPPPPPPPPPCGDPVIIRVLNAAGVVQKSYQLVLGAMAYQPSGTFSVWYSVVAKMNATDYADFSVAVLGPETGAMIIGIYGDLTTDVFTSVSGYYIN